MLDTQEMGIMGLIFIHLSLHYFSESDLSFSLKRKKLEFSCLFEGHGGGGGKAMNQKVNWTTFMKIILVKRTY